MNKNMKIKALIALVCAVLIVNCLLPHAWAQDMSPRASLLIRSTTVSIMPQGNGVLLLHTRLDATRIVDKLGIKSLEIQERVGGFWQTRAVLVTHHYTYNTGTYIYNLEYQGVPGAEYRTYVEFYIENLGEWEIAYVTSTPKTAQ